MNTIGDRIRIRREKIGLSQDELAKKLGYKSRSSINKIETDSRNLTQSKIKALADALNTSPSYIMGWEDDSLSDGKKSPPPGTEDGQNIVRIACRDGSYLEKKLSDEQIAALKVMISQLPEADF